MMTIFSLSVNYLISICTGRIYDLFNALAFLKESKQCLLRLPQSHGNLVSMNCQKKICTPFKSFIYVCLSNLKLNNIYMRFSNSKYTAHITADIKHHYTPSDPPLRLIFCKTDVSAHYRSSLLSTSSSRPHFEETYAHRHPLYLCNHPYGNRAKLT